MHLGVNAIRLTRKFTGVGRYIECILKEWAMMDVPFSKITLYTHSLLNQHDLFFPIDKYNLEIIGKKLPDPLWEWRYLNKISNNVDVLFCPSYTIPLGYKAKCLVTNLGPSENTFLSYEWWKSRCYELLYRYSAHKSDRVCACSHSVKRRLTEVYGIPTEKIKVTYLAASELFHPIRDQAVLDLAKKRYISSENPFILFVGKMARRHCIPNLLKAFAEIKKSRDIPHQMVLVGPDYLNLDIPSRAKSLGIGESVIHIPYVKHDDLPPLYNAAEFFIFPASEAEGFGIPVIEAMACAVPVITVNQGSLREFAQGVTLLTQSSAVTDLRDAMEKLISDHDLRETLAAKGFERSKTITWRITAEKTMEVLWELAKA